MSRSHAVEFRMSAALLSIPALLLGLGLLGAAPKASADPPLNLPSQVTDNAGVLSGDLEGVESRVEELTTEDGIQLWSVFVDSFDGMTAVEWSDQTREMSNLGSPTGLLTVAVDEGAYDFTFLDSENSTSQNESIAQDVAADDIQPALSAGDFAGAVTGAADGLSDSRPGSGSAGGGWIALGIIAAIIIAVVLVVQWSRRRHQKKTDSRIQDANEIPGDDSERLSQLPLEVLEGRARAGVVDADQALEASTTALETARAEFGDLRARPFTEALEKARREVDTAHRLLMRLDDGLDSSRRRGALLEVAARSEHAESLLDEQADAFAEMRDLLITGPESVNALTRRAVTVRTRIPAAQETFDDLQSRFPAEVLSSISDNIEIATELTTAAESEIDRAQAALDRPAGQQAEAVDAIQAADGELSRAETLLGAIDHAADDIATARSGLDDLVAEVEEELTRARALEGATGIDPGTSGQLRQAAADARQAVDAARERGDEDPLGTFSRLTDADIALDEALAAAGDEYDEAKRARAARQAAVKRARGAVREANDYISGRSYVIGQDARSRMAAAKDALAAAEQATGPEVVGMADQAIALSRQALKQAQSDASRASYSGRHGHMGGGGTGLGLGMGRPRYRRRRGGAGSMIGGMVAGALISGMTRGAGSSFGGGRRGWGGGMGGLGRGGGGFGGGFGGGGGGIGRAGGRF